MPPPEADGRRALGRRGEEEAVRYLKGRGYQILARGFRKLRGEIDIIARLGETVVFVEVRARGRTEFGLPLESIKRPKQNQVRKIALAYLQKHRLPEEQTACRFDVLSIVWLEGRAPTITHIENAF